MVNPQHEPTMEEILASIRKIISEDAAAAPAAASAEHGTNEPEVLDLTHEVEVPPIVAADTSAPEMTPDDFHPAPQDEAPAEPVAEPASAQDTPEGIFTEKARKALNEALASIHSQAATDVVAETQAPAAAPAAGETLEAVFERAVKGAFDPVLQKWLADNNDALVERMKPVIRDWLDENFPALLEEAVRCELARAAKPRSRR